MERPDTFFAEQEHVWRRYIWPTVTILMQFPVSRYIPVSAWQFEENDCRR